MNYLCCVIGVLLTMFKVEWCITTCGSQLISFHLHCEFYPKKQRLMKPLEQLTACGVSYVVAGGFGPDRVFSSQGNTAQSNDQQDTHLKITQCAYIVTCPPKPKTHKDIVTIASQVHCAPLL